MAGIGWIKLHRSIWDCELWAQDTAFDDRSAWVDLLLCCCREPKTVKFGAQLIALEPGEYVSSQSRLAERWNWSRRKVSNYLNVLVKLGQLKIRKVDRWSVFTVVKYCEYQGIDIEQQKNGESTGNEQAPRGPSTENVAANQEVKKIKNIENEDIATNLESTVVVQAASPQPVDKCAKAILDFASLFLGGITTFQADQARACLAEVGVDIFAEAVKRSRHKAQTPNYVLKVAYGLLDGKDYTKPRKNDVAAGYAEAMKGDLDDAGF